MKKVAAVVVTYNRKKLFLVIYGTKKLDIITLVRTWGEQVDFTVVSG